MAYLDETGLAYFWQKLKTKLAAKANLASPAFTGTPTAPTPQASDSSTKLATTAYVQGAIGDSVNIGAAAGKLIHVTDAKAGVQVKSLVLYDGSGTEVTGKQVAIANKNLFRIDLLGSSVTDKGVTFTKGADGGITASGTTSGTYAATKCNIDKNALVQGRVYTLSCGGGGTVYAQLAITYNDNTTQYLAASSSHTVFMPSKPVQSVVGSIQITNSGVTVDATVYPQLELAGAASAFENNSYTTITYNGSNLPVLPAEIANLWSTDDTVANIEMAYVQNTAAAIAAADERTTNLEAGKADKAALLFDDYDTTLWTIGTLRSADGTVYTSTNRIRTNYLSKSVKKAAPASGYKMALYIYDSSSTYQGIWNGSEPEKSVMTWFTEAVDFADLPEGSRVRLIAGDTSDSTITTATQDTFAQGIILSRNTDDSISHDGAPANAYTVGRAIYRTKNRTENDPAGLTFWDHTALTSFTPADMPFNSFTEASGGKLSGFGDFDFGSSTLYLIWCWGNSHNTAIRNYFVMNRVGRVFLFGRTINSGASVSWTDWSISGFGVKANAIALTTSWTGSGPYTQTATLTTGTPTANSKIDVQPDAATIAQLVADGVQALYIANNNGTLTAYAIGAAPTAALTLQVTVTEVTT